MSQEHLIKSYLHPCFVSVRSGPISIVIAKILLIEEISVALYNGLICVTFGEQHSCPNHSLHLMDLFYLPFCIELGENQFSTISYDTD